jgi:F-type H+-transporting ATPase subunit delta
LIEKRRIEFLREIADEYEKFLEDYKGLIKARVITAVVLDEGFKNRLKDKLENLSGKKIEIIHKIDRSIIGGIIVHLNNQVIDRSIRYQLNTLRHDLMTIKVH